MNLFFFRLSFDSPTPQKSRHLPLLSPPALPPAPSSLLAITRGDLTPSAPPTPNSRGLRVVQQEQAQGRHLCAGHRTLRTGRERSSSPPLLGSATVPFLILKRLKCNDGPLPSLSEGCLLCTGRRAELTGPGGQAGKASSGFSQHSWGPNIFNG